MTLLAIIAGAFIGAAIQPLGILCARSLLKTREKTYDVALREKIVLCVVLACFGACIGYCAQAIPTAIFLFALLFIADVAASTDFHERIIPNELIIALFAIRIAFGIPALFGIDGFPAFDLLSAVLGCIVCAVIFLAPSLAGKKVGAGDVKFVAAMGFCLGFVLSLYALALMGVLVLAYMLLGRQTSWASCLKQLVPMAPFLCVAMMVVLLVQTAPVALM